MLNVSVLICQRKCKRKQNTCTEPDFNVQIKTVMLICCIQGNTVLRSLGILLLYILKSCYSICGKGNVAFTPGYSSICRQFLLIEETITK